MQISHMQLLGKIVVNVPSEFSFPPFSLLPECSFHMSHALAHVQQSACLRGDAHSYLLSKFIVLPLTRYYIVCPP